MRRRNWIILCGLGALFSAVVPTSSGLAKAETETTVVRESFTDAFPHPCTGVEVSFEGTFQVVFHVTMNDDGSTHVAVEGNASNARGVDADGTKYRATGGFWFEENSHDPLPFNFTVTESFNILSQGDGENFVMHSATHVTVNPDGTVTSEVTQFSEECRG